MKKITKKSLDELAEIMPVLSEKNQHECVGGYYYVDENGSGYLETSGSDMIIYTMNNERDLYFSNGILPTSMMDVLRVDEDTQKAIYENIASNIDYTAFNNVDIINNSTSPIVSLLSGTLIINTNLSYSNTLLYKNAISSAISGVLSNSGEL
jgi:hypothetical protein